MTATEVPDSREDHDEPEGEAHAAPHPTPRQYVVVALILAVATALEITVSFIEVGPVFLPSLIILMVIKFVLVAGWFMHLRFDTATYSRLMGTGLALALGIYAVVLLNMYLHAV